jgi:limonene-1,2-epoxide hydrolase
VAEPIDVVREFCDAWGAPAAIDAALGLLADDCVYHNIPLEPVHGIDDIRATVNGFSAGVDKVTFETLAIAANGSTVLTERIDTFFFPDNTIALPVMGTFEVNAEGKISAWRDYFDMNQFLSQMG